MKIAFCVITKGDEELDKLKTLMNSVIGEFDSYHITANHDHEMTEKWVKGMGWDFSYLKWGDNFAEQRNFNFARVPDDTDYICWADTDDVIINAHLIREIAEISKKNEYDAVYFTYWYGCEFDGEPSLDTFKQIEVTQMRERLLRKGKTKWKKRLHETPVPIDGEKFIHTRVDYSQEHPIAWLHLGADRDLPEEVLHKRTMRNRKLLELDLKEEREKGGADPRTLLYLMKIYAEFPDDDKMLIECIEMGKEYLEKSGWDEERATAYKLMAQCMGNLGRHEDARDLLMNAIKEYPYNPLLYLHLSRTYRNMENWSALKHWLQIGMSLDAEAKKDKQSRTQMDNVLEMKVLAAELMLAYYLYGDRDIRKAWEAARLLNKVNPTPNNQNNENILHNKKELDIATEHVHKLIEYYKDIGRPDMIAPTISSTIEEIKQLPFMVGMFNKYSEPRTWKDNEICYYASLGGEHFEKWSPKSLKEGIGGSETAVIRLTQEWAKMGYKVTVFADVGKEMGVHDGVLWLPYYYFNPRDHFNIFIQWRDNFLAGKINAKKFLIDLHDVWHPVSYKEKVNAIDKIMVKSKYQRELGKELPDNKFEIVSNGI